MASMELQEEQKKSRGEVVVCKQEGKKVSSLSIYTVHTIPLPVYELCNRPEVLAQAEGVDVVDRGHAQVELQGLLPVLPFDLQRYGDALTFTLLQPCQACQQAGAFFSAIAPEQAHPGTHQCRQSVVVVTGSLERTRRLTCDGES